MRFDIITIFPEIFSSFLKTSIIERAISNGLISIYIHNLRNFTDDPHKTTDDYPYGGGAGMVMKPEPIARAIKKTKSDNPSNVIYLTPQGKLFNQEYAEDLGKRKGLILLCGRYRGIDERIRELFVDEEISIGDYILSGGEIASMVVIETVSRLIPDVIGNEASLEEETFANYILDPPQYTRPSEFMGLRVPDILLSGDHKEIERWRREKAIERTKKRRPDLYKKYIKEDKG
ncbi:MAG: tRNA (guanosine(37)-N1)-methyltransferase TrmD [bacterium]